MLEMVVDSVRVCPINNSPTLFLKGKTVDLILPIFVGSAIADAIAAKLGSLSTARPLTHDLLSTVIDELGGSVQRVLINDVRNNVVYAKVALQAKGELHQLDSRPGDAVAHYRVVLAIFGANDRGVDHTGGDRHSNFQEVSMSKSVVNFRYSRLNTLRNSDCPFNIVFMFDGNIEERQD